MTEKILKNNQAVVAGEIISDFEFSHEVFGEGFYFVKLKVSRLSHSSDIIPLLVSERLIDVSQSHIGQFLEARGQFRSYNKHENNRNHLVLSLFVRELELIDSVENRKPNMIFLDGYICKEPVYRTTPLGREIADVQDVFDLHRLASAAGDGGRIAAADFQHTAANGAESHDCNFSHTILPLFLMRLPASGIPFCAPWRRVFTFRFRGALPPQTTDGPAGSAFPQRSSAWFRCAR